MVYTVAKRGEVGGEGEGGQLEETNREGQMAMVDKKELVEVLQGWDNSGERGEGGGLV